MKMLQNFRKDQLFTSGFVKKRQTFPVKLFKKKKKKEDMIQNLDASPHSRVKLYDAFRYLKSSF